MLNRPTLPTPLLLPKISPPRLPATLVARERLLTTLERSLTVPLTLLSASAGSGKTTSLRDWMAHTSRPVAWLSLDQLDNDPTRFWTVFIAALRTCWPEIGQNALTMLSSPQPPALTTILSALLEDVLDLGASEQPAKPIADSTEKRTEHVVLIIDDYHSISESSIHDGMIFLLDHLPATMHLLLASRVNPPFPLARWRLYGLMEEIRVADLSFTHEETKRFLLERMRLSLAEEDVKQLVVRTEGWAAGLQLTALACDNTKIPRRLSNISAAAIACSWIMYRKRFWSASQRTYGVFCSRSR